MQGLREAVETQGRATAPLPMAERRRLLVIYNPTAGRRSLRRLGRFLAQLERLGVAVVLRETLSRGDAEAFARGADAGEFDAVVAAGGDGTINEVVNGLADSALPLAIMPLGTANVLANEIGLPRDPERIAEIAVAGAARPIRLGAVAGRRFVMMAGIGFDAAVVARLDLALKRRVGKLALVKAIIEQLLRHGASRYRVSCEGADHLPGSAVIANGRFYAGRFVLAPAARLEDPTLQLILLMRSGRLAMTRYLIAMALGRVHRLRDVRILCTARLTVSGPSGAKVQADGDIVGTVPVTVSVDARPLWLIQPASAPR